MNNKSLNNSYDFKNSNKPKETLFEIKNKLSYFINHKANFSRLREGKITYSALSKDTKLFFFLLLTIFFLLVSAILFIAKHDFLELAGKITIFISFCLLFYTICTSYKTIISELRSKKNIIDKMPVYNLNLYQQTIEELGMSFSEKDLNEVQTMINLDMRKRKNTASILKKSISLIAIILVVVVIVIAIPNSLIKNSDINWFYGTVSGTSGIVFVVKVGLELFYERQEQKDIEAYETCISILQKAQVIAREEEVDAIKVYDEAIAVGDEAIPFEQATSEIEANF